MMPGASLGHGAGGKRLAAALLAPRQGQRAGMTPGHLPAREPEAGMGANASGALVHFGRVAEAELRKRGAHCEGRLVLRRVRYEVAGVFGDHSEAPGRRRATADHLASDEVL